MEWPVPPGFNSDGCTVPFFVRWYYKRYTVACKRHDWARRHLVYYRIITVAQADAQLRNEWEELGMPRLIAVFSWNIVKLTRGYYKRTLPIPLADPSWATYIEKAREMEAGR